MLKLSELELDPQAKLKSCVRRGVSGENMNGDLRQLRRDLAIMPRRSLNDGHQFDHLWGGANRCQFTSGNFTLQKTTVLIGDWSRNFGD